MKTMWGIIQEENKRVNNLLNGLKNNNTKKDIEEKIGLITNHISKLNVFLETNEGMKNKGNTRELNNAVESRSTSIKHEIIAWNKKILDLEKALKRAEF